MDAEFIELIAQSGALSTGEIMRALDVSGNTVSRLARSNPREIVKLGGSKNTRYAARAPILGLPDEQPLFWIDPDGSARPFATLNAITGGRVYLSVSPENLPANEAPWLLATLVQAGFLGRAVAQRFTAAPYQFDSNPERWNFAQHLFVALNPNVDVPGAILLGEAALESWRAQRIAPNARAEDYDALAINARSPSGIGTSAGGEQPKFLAVRNDTHVLVKFSPPRGTPNGERWRDLLHCEALAANVLMQFEIPAAQNRIIESATRTFLESDRIDRVGRAGRRHALPLSAIHRAFVGGTLQKWPRTAAALTQQNRISKDDARTIALVYRFGEYIGNNDMHFGNLSLIADTPEHAKKGKFCLAPIYDMLPMRFRPDDNVHDFGYTPFAIAPPIPGEERIDSEAKAMARMFWERVAQSKSVTESIKTFATQFQKSIQ